MRETSLFCLQFPERFCLKKVVVLKDITASVSPDLEAGSESSVSVERRPVYLLKPLATPFCIRSVQKMGMLFVERVSVVLGKSETFSLVVVHLFSRLTVVNCIAGPPTQVSPQAQLRRAGWLSTGSCKAGRKQHHRGEFGVTERD